MHVRVVCAANDRPAQAEQESEPVERHEELPAPKQVDGRNIWDRLALDESFVALPSKEDANEWDGEDAA